MENEGITYDPLGTVTVQFDDRKYVLGRPKLKHLRYFRRRLQTMRDDAVAKLKELTEAVEAAGTEKARVKAEGQLREYSLTPFYEDSLEWTREVFAQLGDPLPDDADEWPAWLAADGTLPARIVAHWQTAPKVSGENPS